MKRSGREPVWVVIHMCVEAMLGISLYSSLYLKLAKKKCSVFLIISCFLFNNIGEQEGGTGSAQKVGRWGGGPNNIYTCE
jgi:hypothetical protein